MLTLGGWPSSDTLGEGSQMDWHCLSESCAAPEALQTVPSLMGHQIRRSSLLLSRDCTSMMRPALLSACSLRGCLAVQGLGALEWLPLLL